MDLSINGIKLLFGFLSSLEQAVFWMRSPNYQQQLYISPSFEKIWGESCNLIYQMPEKWSEFLLPEDHKKIITDIEQRTDLIQDKNKSCEQTVHYRIKHPSGNIRYIQDHCFTLYKPPGQILAYVGIAADITQKQWKDNIEKNNHPLPSVRSLEQILNNDFGLKLASSKPEPSFNENIHHPAVVSGPCGRVALNRREVQCLNYLRQGKTAKETGTLLHLSARTVEYYLDNIKQKTGCRTKLELLTLLKY